MSEIPGMFDLIMSKIHDAEVKSLSKAPRGPRNQPRDLTQLPQLARCGNCANISYHGIMEIKLEWGVCEMWKQNDRLVNKPSFKPCEFWRRRSPLLMTNEQAYANEVYNKLVEMNGKVKGGSRNVDDVGVGRVRRPKELDENKKKSATAALAELGFSLGMEGEEVDDDYIDSGQAAEDLETIMEGEDDE